MSMDVKLPSVDGEQVAADVQRNFLGAAIEAGTTVWVKIVIGASTDPVQFDAAVRMVAEVAEVLATTARTSVSGGADHRPEVFLQPVTPFGTVDAAPTADQVLELQERALRRYPRVRVVPQTHKAIGQL